MTGGASSTRWFLKLKPLAPSLLLNGRSKPFHFALYPCQERLVVAEGFFVVVVAEGFLVVSAAVADAGLFVAEPVLFAGLLDVTAEELLSCLFVEGFDVSEEASDELFCLSELSADELFCLSELSADELFCLSELVLSEASDEVS